MKFDNDQKVIIDTMNREQAIAFVKFLGSEILRHNMDIAEAANLIKIVKSKFKLWEDE